MRFWQFGFDILLPQAAQVYLFRVYPSSLVQVIFLIESNRTLTPFITLLQVFLSLVLCLLVPLLLKLELRTPL